MDLLVEGEAEEEVKLRAGVSWRVLASWCFDPVHGPLVPDDVAEVLLRQEEAVSVRRKAEAHKGRAKAGVSLTDTDRAYRDLVEEIAFLKKEHEAFYGQPYEYGMFNDELDQKVDLERHWFG